MTAPAVRSRAPWVGVAAALFAVGWGANQFSSLLLSYRLHQHVSTATADALFGVYALGLIPSLLVGGPLSDRRGRRRIVLPVTAVSAATTVTLMLGAAAGVSALYAGRFLAGVVSGLAFAPGTAWVKELSAPPFDPGATPTLGGRRAAVALSSGFGAGALVAGLIAQWSPAPGVTPYIVHLVVVAVALPLAWSAPETVGRDATRSAGREPVPSRAARPAAAMRWGLGHPRFLRVVAPMAPWVFGAPAISFAVLPAQVTHRTHGYEVAFAAVVAGVTLAAGVAAQPLARWLATFELGVGSETGLAAVAAGVALGALASRSDQPTLVLVAAVLLGAGYGTCLVSGLLEVQGIAAEHHLAGLTAVFYALTYLGFGAPLLMAAVHADAGYPTILWATAGLAVATLVAIHVGGRTAPAPSAPGSPAPSPGSRARPTASA